MHTLSQIGIFALVTLVIAALPLIASAVYAAAPNEARLALMRPVSLAGLFAGLAGTLKGGVAVLQGMGATPELMPTSWGRVYNGLSEALVPAVLSFSCLTVAWLLVAVGMWRGVRDA